MSVTLTDSSSNSTAATALYSRLNWRLLPFLLLCYIFAALDRNNIGFAKLQMQSDLQFSDAAYGFGAGVFFIGYVLFEIPSNLMLPRVGARKTFSRILVLWGLVSSGMLFVQGEISFYVLRFLLGVFEAGFVPGMIFYLTYWYGKTNMARVMAIVLMAGPISGIIAGPLSGAIMVYLSGVHGLAGWQWMFLIEGLPCVLLGALSLVLLTDKPADATWLSAEEKLLLTAGRSDERPRHQSFGQVARDPRVYMMAGVLFCLINGLYTVAFWLPSIIKGSGVTDTMSIAVYSAIPYIGGCIAMHLIGASSDRVGDRRWHAAVTALLGAVALAGAAVLGAQLLQALVCMTAATAMIYASYTVFWAMPSEHLHGDAAAGGIALINSIALLGGFFSPNIIGIARTVTGSLQAGLLVMAALLLIGSILLLLLKGRAPAI